MADGKTNWGEIAERLRRSTVAIHTAGGGGSGVGVAEGVVATNAHVAASNRLEIETWEGARLGAELLWRDAGRDLALVRLSNATTAPAPAKLGDAQALRAGDEVMAVGNPLGFIGAAALGRVRGVGRMQGLGPGLSLQTWVQSEVRLAPGSSGGPLANARGEVIGLNTMIVGGFAGRNIGLAVPSNHVATMLTGGTRQPRLGVRARAVRLREGAKARSGFFILEVGRNSAAEAASLMPGDIVIAVGGCTVADEAELESALAGAAAAGVARVQFLRGDRRRVRTAAVRLQAL